MIFYITLAFFVVIYTRKVKNRKNTFRQSYFY